MSMIEDIRDITSFKWATVTDDSPLAIRLDGDTSPLAVEPDSLVDPQSLEIGDRVRVEMSLRKVVIHGRVGGDTPPEVRRVFTGTVDANWNAGAMSVTLDTGAVVTITGADRDITVAAGDNVTVIKRPDGNHYITGIYATIFQGGYANLSGGSAPYVPWDPRSWNPYEPARMQGKLLNPLSAIVVHRNSSGVVSASGLGITKAVANGGVIGVLPAGFRPAVYHRFRGEIGGAQLNFEVRTDGQIIALQTISAGTYFSLSGMLFHAAGQDLVWTTIPAFSNSFSGSSIGTFGVPAYAMDAYGDVWLRGLVTKAATVATNDYAIFTLPVGYRATLQHHFNAYHSNAAYRFLGLDAATGVVTAKSGWTGGNVASLSGIVISPTARDNDYYNWALGSGPAGNSMGYLNSWVDFGSVYTRGGYLRRPDGLVLARGLVANGTITTNIGGMPPGFWPIGRCGFHRPSNALAGRVDVQGWRAQDGNGGGTISGDGGSSAWISLDGVAWQSYY